MINNDLEKAKINYRLKLNIAAAIKNSVSLICFTVLAIVFDKWWLEENYKYGDSAFYPKSMTPDELRDGCKEARYEFNTYKNIFRRLFRNKVHRNLFNMFVFIVLNIISRKEIHRKQGKVLGGK